VLNGGPLHGFAIAERIHVLSREVLTVEEGSLYPALYRMEAKGWIEPEWGISPRGRRAKLYSLTKEGRKQLANEQQIWGPDGFRYWRCAKEHLRFHELVETISLLGRSARLEAPAGAGNGR